MAETIVPRLTKRMVEAAEIRPADYFLWDDDLPGFGARILPSGKRTYLVQYRSGGRSRRASIGLHGRLTCEEARKEAMALPGQVAKGGDPAEERATRRQSMTVRELCTRYREAAEKGLILGKRGPKRPLTLASDWGELSGTSSRYSATNWCVTLPTQISLGSSATLQPTRLPG
jgi:hypothetical protein